MRLHRLGDGGQHDLGAKGKLLGLLPPDVDGVGYPSHQHREGQTEKLERILLEVVWKSLRFTALAKLMQNI